MTTERTHSEREPAGIHVPRPTAAPLYFALGVSLLLAGLVTHELVSAVGAVAAVLGAVGWWREVLPHEREQLVPLQSEDRRARRIEPRVGAVDHLTAGEAGHRMRLPVEVRPLSSGLPGAAAGAVAMAVVACAYGLVAEGSVWYPINLLAGIVLPAVDVATPEELRSFHGAAFAAACVAHALLSIGVGLVYAATLPMLPSRPLLWGGVVAPLLWTAVAWSLMGLVNPALEARVSWPWFVASQVAFGVAAGLAILRVQPVATMQSRSLAERAGIEAGG